MSDLEGDQVKHLGRAHIRYTRPVPIPILRWLVELCRAFFDANAQAPKRFTRLTLELPLAETHLALTCGDSLAIFQDFPLLRKMIDLSTRSEQGILSPVASPSDVEAFVRSRFNKAPASTRTMLTFVNSDELHLWENRVNHRRRRRGTCSLVGAVINLGQPESPRTTTPLSEADPLSFYASEPQEATPLEASADCDFQLVNRAPVAKSLSYSSSNQSEDALHANRVRRFASQNQSLGVTIYEDAVEKLLDPQAEQEDLLESSIANATSFTTLLQRHLQEVKSAIAPSGSATPRHFLLGRQQMFSRIESPLVI